MTEIAMDIINRLKLTPLDGEGGYFRFLHEFGEGSGSIYYLVTDDSFSHLHALSSDELWFFLEGDEAEQVIVDENGDIERRILNAENRDSLVLKDHHQATRIKKSVLGYSLFSTIMSPKYSDDMYTSGSNDPIVYCIKELEDLL